MVAPNIFRPRNDWNVISLRCKKPTYQDRFVNRVARIVNEETGVNPLNYRHFRGRRCVEARQLFLVMMTKYTKRTYTDIAAIVGKDHATINHCIKTVSDRCETDRYYRERLEKIEEKVKAIMI